MKFAFMALLSASFCANSIVIRHDVDDQKYQVPANTVPQLATFYVDGAHGTLIDPKWILTAAHATFCVVPGAEVLINERRVPVEQVFVHKDYTPGISHDIALVKLAEPVTDVKPFTINTQADEEGRILWLIGIGGTGNGSAGQTIDSFANAGVLRRAQNQVARADGPTMTFVFDQGPDALPLEGVSGGGDSGGPAYTFECGQGTVYGISSRVKGGGIGRYGVQEIYSRISYFSEWIKQVIDGRDTAAIADPRLKRLPGGLTRDVLPEVCEDIGL